MPQSEEGNCKAVEAIIRRTVTELKRNPHILFNPHSTEKEIAERDIRTVIVQAVKVHNEAASAVLDNNFREVIGFNYRPQPPLSFKVIPVIEPGLKGTLAKLLN